jgi:dienelactone hydrolase
LGKQSRHQGGGRAPVFEYFPDNYSWSLAVMLALQCGGVISEIDDGCRDLKPVAADPENEVLPQWQRSWATLADRAQALAECDLARGYTLSAGSKFRRAAAYALISERMMRGRDAARTQAYIRARDLVRRSIELWNEPVEQVEIPYDHSSLPGLFYRAAGSARHPCLIFFSGFDVSKEYLWLFGIGRELAARGISVLFIDHPGVGEALRLRDLYGFPETERAASPCVDYLQARADIDRARIGVIGVSLGGYYAARSAAFEKRLAACICWGAQWDYGAVTRARARRQGTALSVSSWAEHAQWVFGVDDMDRVLEITARMTLEGVAGLIECPLLVIHGDGDRQIPVAHAHKLFAAATRASIKELKLFDKATGGAEHCQADNSLLGIEFFADWAAAIFGTAAVQRLARADREGAIQGASVA